MPLHWNDGAVELRSNAGRLRRSGASFGCILAVHNHMLDEEPRIFFLHYWGTGKAENLAGAFRDTLGQLKESGAK